MGVYAGSFDGPNWFEISPANSKHIFLGVAIHGTMIPPQVPAFIEHARTLENVPIEPMIFDQAVAVDSLAHLETGDQDRPAGTTA